ncbi:MAG: hypothetical protein M3164_01250, partial [Actinomycetota bacterium]|nr:hypothetical protein [Actinomycetota bacterium]
MPNKTLETNLVAGIWPPEVLERILEERQAAVAEVARAFTIAGLATQAHVLLVVLPRSRDAERFYESLKVWMDAGDVSLYPAWEALPGEAISPTLETMGKRIKLLRDLSSGRPPKVIVTSVRAAVQGVAEPPESTITLRPGTEIPLEEIAKGLVDYGFERNYLVERPGEFSVRGGILDVFPADGGPPFRADFFGDEITDLRRFSATTQRSEGPLEAVAVTPCRELRLSDEVRAKAASLLESGSFEGERREDLERLANGVPFPGMEAYLGLLAGPLRKVTDLLPPEGNVVLCDPKQCRDRAADFLEQAASWGGEQSESLFVDFGEVAQGAVELWAYRRAEEGVDLDVTGWDEYAGRVDALAERLSDVLRSGATVTVAAGRGADRAREVLAESGLGLPVAGPRLGRGVITADGVGKGFLLKFEGEPALAVVGEADLFGRRRQAASPPAQVPARATALVLELAPGDYVVH